LRRFMAQRSRWAPRIIEGSGSNRGTASRAS